jgi:hypothetical protein
MSAPQPVERSKRHSVAIEGKADIICAVCYGKMSTGPSCNLVLVAWTL